MKKIIFKSDRKIAQAAKIKKISEKKSFMFFLKFSLFLGLVSAIYICFSVFSGLVAVPVFLPRLFVFLGLTSLVTFVFLKNYPREVERSNSLLAEAETFDIYKISTLELVEVFERSCRGTLDLRALANDILKTNRVIFILNEMGLGRDGINQYIVPENITEGLAEKVFEDAIENAIHEGESRITSADVLYGLVKNSPAFEGLLVNKDLTREDFENIVFWSNNFFGKIENKKTFVEKMKASNGGVAGNWASGYTLNLDRYSYDISNPNYFGSFSVEGREKVLLRAENILAKEAKNNCLFVGEVGVGKTTLALGLAEKVYWGEVPLGLSHKRVVSLDVAALLTGAKDKGEIQQRLRSVLDEATRAGNIILFIDDIHTILNSGSKIGSVDASEILIPYLTNPDLKIVGATTAGSYESFIEPKSELAGFFEKVEVEPTDKNQTLKILEDLSMHYRGKYQIYITYNALKEVYSLAEKFVTNKAFPASAIDMLDSACSAAKNRGDKVLNSEVIDSIAEEVLNVPIAEVKVDEKEKLLNLEAQLHKRVIGQEEAISAVSNALRRARAQVGESKRPIGSFLFLGPTGVGKTELAKALAEVYFGNEDAMIRADMSEYQRSDSIDRFLGRKVSDRDELEGGDFVKKVREKPFSVILLDELEKAYPDILNIFLQVLDEGFLTDGMGKKLIFSNTIIIATSNAGANLIREAVGKSLPPENLKESLLTYLQNENIYRSEFLNRFDSLVVFKPLTKEELGQVAGLMLGQVMKDLKEKGYSVSAEPSLTQQIVEWGYQPELGARPMRRALQDKFESFIAKKILEGSLKKGEPYLVKSSDFDDTKDG